MAVWDQSDVGSGQTIKSLHVRQAQNNWQGDVAANGASISALARVLQSIVTVTYSATPTFDASLGDIFKITLTGNVTSSTLSNLTAGQRITIIVIQDATGGRTFVWPTNVFGVMDIGTDASAKNIQELIALDASNAYGRAIGNTI